MTPTGCRRRHRPKRVPNQTTLVAIALSLCTLPQWRTANAFLAPSPFRPPDSNDVPRFDRDYKYDERSSRGGGSVLAARTTSGRGRFSLPKFKNDRTPSSSSSSALSMVAKSGGQMITTDEQFAIEVLCQETEFYGGESVEDSDDKIDDQQRSKSEVPSPPVLVFFSAPWCGPCRLTNPVVKEVMKQYQSQIDVVEVSTDDLPDVASNAGVLSIPTIQLYYEGKVMDTIVGCVAKNVLARAVDKVLEDLGLLEEEDEAAEGKGGGDSSP